MLTTPWEGMVEDIASRLRELASEQEDKRSNMPDALQDSDTGQLLEERAQNMESAADEFDGIDFSDVPEAEEFDESAHEREEGESEEDHKARVEEAREQHEAAHNEAVEAYWQEKLEEVQAVSIDS